jgi:TPP-dependent indolepyruvate ferredoxin oxidoreductase alpha subunit
MPFGLGRGRGRGQGRRKRSGRRGQVPRRRVDADLHCICPQCQTIVPFHSGVPCFQTRCPNCGAQMTRKFHVPDQPVLSDSRPTSPKPVVDPALCTGCEVCVNICPENAIEISNNVAVIHAASCTNCRKCIAVCPVSAIK